MTTANDLMLVLILKIVILRVIEILLSMYLYHAELQSKRAAFSVIVQHPHMNISVRASTLTLSEAVQTVRQQSLNRVGTERFTLGSTLENAYIFCL